MIYLERLRPAHVTEIHLQPAQQLVQAVLSPEYAEQLVAQPGVAWAALLDGQTLACAGMTEVGPQRAIAWALFSEAALRHFGPIHRATRQILAEVPWRRVEMAVDAQHVAAIRWAERLGFAREGLMRAYTADGRDCFLYARVK